MVRVGGRLMRLVGFSEALWKCSEQSALERQRSWTSPLTGLPAPFTEFPVKRTSTWIYHKGSYVRELTSPTNHHYVLQSWTTMISSKVVASKLNTLASGSKPLLTLPKGWKFKARKLTKQLVIIAPGTMTLVQDNLKGVYSKIS